MNKKCARCEKTVYPIEELKCLDKIWHKQCFRCNECNMTLNMRTYKGFNKQPYCEAHIPKAKATTMAETPELKRIAENTKIQSNIKYHAEFEKAKGKFTQVADDPETLRIKQNSKIISNAVYHGEKEKKAAMEQKRAISGENGDGDGSSDDYKPSSGGYNNHAPPVHKQQHAMGRVYKALYDYDAQDSDEVSFIDGDLIVNCTPIDEGWMTGLVQRTGQSGMLPANYVEPAN